MPPIPKTAEHWTPEIIGRFWAWYASQPHLHEQYFSRRVGSGVVEVLRLTGALRGRVLDYGCGPGYLLGHLLKQPGVTCCGCDFSAEAVSQVDAKFAGRSNWSGAIRIQSLPTPYSDAEFDVVTCVETIEHLPDDQIADVLKELKRLVKNDGLVLFTTPHDEMLELSQVYCPFCEAQFHNVQHLRAFSIDSLRQTLADAGFDVVFCGNLNFVDFMRRRRTRFKDWSLRELRNAVRRGLWAIHDRLNDKPFPARPTFVRRTGNGPHLCALVRPAK